MHKRISVGSSICLVGLCILLTLADACKNLDPFEAEVSSVSRSLAGSLGEGSVPAIRRDGDSAIAEWHYEVLEPVSNVRAAVRTPCPDGYKPTQEANETLTLVKGGDGDTFQLNVALSEGSGETHVSVILRAYPD